MNLKQLIAAGIVFTAAGYALATTAAPAETQQISGKTRAEVIAELQQARAEGLMDYNDLTYPIQTPVKSARTREEVSAEAIAAAKHQPHGYE
jgi:hypothetical protein